MSEVAVFDVVDAAGTTVNTIALADPSAWTPPAGCAVRPHVPVVPPPWQPPPQLALTQLAFLRRFTAAERIAARASSDPVIVDFLHLLALAQEVRLDDSDTQAGVRYLETVGILATGRADVILTPAES